MTTPSLLDLEHTRQQIIGQMTDIDRDLSLMRRNDHRRFELISRKGLLLRQLREQNVRIAQAKKAEKGEPGGAPVAAVSDHALVRWLERKHGIDVDRLRSLMLTPEIRSALATEQRYWSDGSVVYVLKDQTVVTVIPVAELPGATA